MKAKIIATVVTLLTFVIGIGLFIILMNTGLMPYCMIGILCLLAFAVVWIQVYDAIKNYYN